MATLERYVLKGLDCANCAARLEQALRAADGLEEARVNFAASSVELNPAALAEARRIIASLHPEVEVVPLAPPPLETTVKRAALAEFLVSQQAVLRPMAAAALLMAVGLWLEAPLQRRGWVALEYLLFGAAYLSAGFDVLRTAFRNARRGQVFDENTLMTLATLGALALRQLPEAVMVMLLYSLGEALQSFAVQRVRRSIAALVSLRPDAARVQRGLEVALVPPESMAIGELIVVQPGDRVPLDGEVVRGESFADTSALTGEPVPRRLAPGDHALAGMVALSGRLVLKVERAFADSAISRILRLVEQAAGRKTRTERLITSFSRYYTPAVTLLAAAVAVLPPLFIPGATFAVWGYRALVLLVISCPCALVISVPLGYFGGLGAASRHGILVKGANFLDALASLETVLFDKTGTLTEGAFSVRSIHPESGVSEREVLAAAAAIEAISPHPIAASIRAAWGEAADVPAPGGYEECEEYEEVPGGGVKGRVRGRCIVAGNDRLLKQEGIAHAAPAGGAPGTVVHVAVDGRYYGYLVIADALKPGARDALDQLRALGVKRLGLLTGDDAGGAAPVREALGLDAAWAGLLPEGKVAVVEELAAARPGSRLAFVGDGINDAPVLTRADVGIAMGALGSQAAIEAADVVIMDDQLAKVGEAVRIACRTRAVVAQNIAFALGVKALFLLLGAAGLSGIGMAVFADTGVALLAVLNSTRTLRFRAGAPGAKEAPGLLARPGEGATPAGASEGGEGGLREEQGGWLQRRQRWRNQPMKDWFLRLGCRSTCDEPAAAGRAATVRRSRPSRRIRGNRSARSAGIPAASGRSGPL
ncbi:MAG: heavy metal translocating P-type ATPase [Chitinophagales bacterium]